MLEIRVSDRQLSATKGQLNCERLPGTEYMTRLRMLYPGTHVPVSVELCTFDIPLPPACVPAASPSRYNQVMKKSEILEYLKAESGCAGGCALEDTQGEVRRAKEFRHRIDEAA